LQVRLVLLFGLREWEGCGWPNPNPNQLAGGSPHIRAGARARARARARAKARDRARARARARVRARGGHREPLVAPQVGPQLPPDELELVDAAERGAARADRKSTPQPEVARVQHINVRRA